MVNCFVSFNGNQNGIFYSGQEVSGSVTLHNEKPRMIRALLLKLEGYAQTRWTETNSNSSSSSTSSTYSAHEDFLKTTTVIRNYAVDEEELPVGQHTFSFCFQLPLTIPSSFKNLYGDIEYQIKFEMDRKLKFNHSFVFPFTVITGLDLNYEDVALKQPLKVEMSKKFLFNRGSVVLTAALPFCGYVAGQMLSVDVKIVNGSSVKVDRVLVHLYRICHFKCENSISTKDDFQLLVKGEHEGVAVKETSQMTFSLEIPPVEPTNVRFSKYIFTKFELLIKAKVGGLHRSPYLRIPITIGTVPLRDIPSSSSPQSFDVFEKLGKLNFN